MKIKIKESISLIEVEFIREQPDGSIVVRLLESAYPYPKGFVRAVRRSCVNTHIASITIHHD